MLGITFEFVLHSRTGSLVSLQASILLSSACVLSWLLSTERNMLDLSFEACIHGMRVGTVGTSF